MYLWNLIFLCLIHYGSSDVFTSSTNLEKLFYMEEETMSMVDVFLRQEFFEHGDEDPHNLKPVLDLTKRCKEIHQNVTTVREYITHPVNVLHLTRRLYLQWPDALLLIKKSEPCQKWHVPHLLSKLNNIKKNLPTRKDLLKVAYNIVMIQKLYDIPFDQIKAGIIVSHKSVEPMSVTDLFYMALAAYNEKLYNYTALFLTEIKKSCKDSKYVNETYCKETKSLSMLASSYYELSQYDKALEATEAILKIDPDSKVSKLNKKFFEARIGMERQPHKTHQLKTYTWMYEMTCSGKRQKKTTENARLRCMPFHTSLPFVYEKAEVLNRSPPVIVFHHMVGKRQASKLLLDALDGFRRISYQDVYNTPTFTQILNKKRVETIQRRFSHIRGLVIPPFEAGTTEVRNYGLGGMYFRHDRNNPIPSLGADIASFFTFLNDDQEAAYYVFPKLKIRIKAEKGSTVFFLATKSSLCVCPVAYGATWVAVHSVFQQPTNMCRLYDDSRET